MLNFKDLFTPHHIAVLVDWLDEKGELCVEIYIPHGGGSASYFTITSLADLKRLVGDLRSLEIQITIWKNRKKEEFESGTTSQSMTTCGGFIFTPTKSCISPYKRIEIGASPIRNIPRNTRRKWKSG